MTPQSPVFQLEWVRHIPAELAEGVLYISEEFETAMHRCPCGCGQPVVTPLGQDWWRLTKHPEDGTVTLAPSIGNTFECRSHYFIRHSHVEWA